MRPLAAGLEWFLLFERAGEAWMPRQAPGGFLPGGWPPAPAGMPEAGLSQALGLASWRDWSMLSSALTKSFARRCV